MYVFDSQLSETGRWVKAWTWYVNLVLYQQQPRSESIRLMAKREGGTISPESGVAELPSGENWLAFLDEWDALNSRPVLEMIAMDVQWLHARREMELA